METENSVKSIPSNGKPECCDNENIVSETICLEANSKMMLEDIYTKCSMKERELICILEKIKNMENDLSDGIKEEEKIQYRFSTLRRQKNLLNSSDDDKIAIATVEFEATLYEKDEQIETLETILRRCSQSNRVNE